MVVVSIAGKKHWLWRAVDQEGHILDEILQTRCDPKAAGAGLGDRPDRRRDRDGVLLCLLEAVSPIQGTALRGSTTDVHNAHALLPRSSDLELSVGYCRNYFAAAQLALACRKNKKSGGSIWQAHMDLHRWAKNANRRHGGSRPKAAGRQSPGVALH
jgi:hypothetical protein